MAKKRDKSTSTDAGKLERKSLRKAARRAAQEAIAAESQAVIDLVEADALAAAARARGSESVWRRHAEPAERPSSKAQAEAEAVPAAKTKKGKKKRKKTARHTGTSKPRQPGHWDSAQSSRGSQAHVHDHGRVEDDEAHAQFSRLVREIAGLVQLVEQHRPEVRRAVFDSYVTAVIEFGATAKDLGFVDVRDALLVDDDDDDVVVDAVVTAPTTGDFAPGGVLAFGHDADDIELDAVPRSRRRRSFDSPSSAASTPAGPVREAEGLERAAAAPRRARTSVHRGRSGLSPQEPVDARPEGAPDDGRHVAVPIDAGAGQTLESLVALEPPRNNDERNAVIVQWHGFAGTPATIDAIEAGYERMGWRVPVDVRSSLRQSVRKGLVQFGDDGTYRSI